MKKIFICAIAIFCAAGAFMFSEPGTAASGNALYVSVKDQNGMPVRDAVVMVYPASGIRTPVRFPWRNVMNQKDISFQPGTLIVPKGSTVSFPNHDRVRHSVYSFSKAARFELSLYGRDQSRSQGFPVEGPVALGCNIHDEMKGYIRVVDTPYAQKTNHNGRLLIDNLPLGSAKIEIWHPGNRVRGGNSVITSYISSGSNSQTVSLNIR